MRPMGIHNTAKKGSVAAVVSMKRRMTTAQPERTVWSMSSQPSAPRASASTVSYAKR